MRDRGSMERAVLDPSWLERARREAVPVIAHAEGAIRHALRSASHHTGLPAVVVAALALVLAWRIAKRTWHVALELALALGLLLAATKLGWIRW